MGIFSKDKPTISRRAEVEKEVAEAAELLKKIMSDNGVTELCVVNDVNEDEKLMFSYSDALRFRQTCDREASLFRFTRFGLFDGEIKCKGQAINGEEFGEEFIEWVSISDIPYDEMVDLDSIHILDLAKWIEQEYDVCAANKHASSQDNGCESIVLDFSIEDDFNIFDEESPEEDADQSDNGNVDALWIKRKSHMDSETAAKILEMVDALFKIHSIKRLGLWSRDFVQLYAQGCEYNDDDRQLFANIIPSFYFDLFKGEDGSRIFAVEAGRGTVYVYYTDTANSCVKRTTAQRIYERPRQYAICFDDVVNAIFKSIELNESNQIPEDKWHLAHIPVVNPYTYAYIELVPPMKFLSDKISSMQELLHTESDALTDEELDEMENLLKEEGDDSCDEEDEDLYDDGDDDEDLYDDEEMED